MTKKVRKGELRVSVASALAKMGAFSSDTAVIAADLAAQMGIDPKVVSTCFNNAYTRGTMERKPFRSKEHSGTRFAYWLKGRKPPKPGTVAASEPTPFTISQAAEERQQKRDERYGKEVMLQVPCGDGQTRSFNLKQATIIYRYLHAMRHLFKENGGT